jgi:catechol 2,3-dioxygenase-like lactoylglutathione lyase family enzyme
MPTDHPSSARLRLAKVVLPVRDAALMRVFYRDVLGLEETPSPDPACTNLDAGGMTLSLQSGSSFVRDNDAGAARIVFMVDDVDATRAQLVEQGVKLGKLKSFGNLASCDGTDPEGNPFRLSNH